MKFHMAHDSLGFRSSGELAQLAYFLDMGYFPNIGYNRNNEINNPVRRREEHLPPYEEMAERGDPHYTNVNLISENADGSTTTRVSARLGIKSPCRRAIYRNNGDKTDETSMNTPWAPLRRSAFFDFNSGRFAVKRERYQGVNVEVYYDPKNAFDG